MPHVAAGPSANGDEKYKTFARSPLEVHITAHRSARGQVTVRELFGRLGIIRRIALNTARALPLPVIRVERERFVAIVRIRDANAGHGRAIVVGQTRHDLVNRDRHAVRELDGRANRQLLPTDRLVGPGLPSIIVRRIFGLRFPHRLRAVHGIVNRRAVHALTGDNRDDRDDVHGDRSDCKALPRAFAAHAGNQAHDGENRPDKRGEKRHVVDDRHQRCHECDDSEHQAGDGKPRSRLFRLFNFHVFPPIAAVFPSNHFGDAHYLHPCAPFH